MSRIEIRDVTPRDGLQDLADVVPTERKAELVRRLLATGLRAVEVTSFVSASRVPQLADAEELCGLLTAERPDHVVLSAFVATSRGAERAVAAGVDELSTAVPATDGMSEANFRRSSEVLLDELVALRAEHAGVRMSVTVAVAFGCPFEGRVPADRVLGIVDRLVSSGYRTVYLGDTVGVGNPRQVGELYDRLVERFPGITFGAHFHDPRGVGIANVVAAVNAGASAVDAALGGLGGCPFAPGAAGNVATEDIVWALADMGYTVDPRPQAVVDAARWVSTELGFPLRSRTPEATRFDWEHDAVRH